MAPSTLLPPSLYRSPDPAAQRARIERAAQVYERWRTVGRIGPRHPDFGVFPGEFDAAGVELWAAIDDTRSNHAHVAALTYVIDRCGEITRRDAATARLHPASDGQRLPRIYRTWPAGTRVV